MVDNEIKIVFVGDPGSGKTCVIRRYHENIFEESYNATLYQRHEKFHRFADKGYILAIDEARGQPEDARIRPLQYHSADVFVICFAIADDPKDVSLARMSNMSTANQVLSPLVAENSFFNVSSYWYPEVCQFKTDRAKIVLLGNKSDLRDEASAKQEFAVTPRQGKKLAKSLKIDSYFECSSKTGHNIEGLFDRIIETHLQVKPMRKRRACKIL